MDEDVQSLVCRCGFWVLDFCSLSFRCFCSGRFGALWGDTHGRFWFMGSVWHAAVDVEWFNLKYGEGHSLTLRKRNYEPIFFFWRVVRHLNVNNDRYIKVYLLLNGTFGFWTGPLLESENFFFRKYLICKHIKDHFWAYFGMVVT